MVASSSHSVRNDNQQHNALHRSSSSSSTSIIRKRIATSDDSSSSSSVFRAFKRLLFSRRIALKSNKNNYLIINTICVALLLGVANKLKIVAAQAFGAGGYGGMPAAGTPGGQMFQQAMLLDLLDVNERMREAIMMQTMLQNGALGGAGGGAGAGGAYGMNPALGLTAGDPSLGAAFAAAAAQQVAAASLPQMQMAAQFMPQPQQQAAPAITNKSPFAVFDPMARYELQHQLVQQQQQQPQQQAFVAPAVGGDGGGGLEQHPPQAALHQAYFAPLQSNAAAYAGALGLGSAGENNVAESGAGGPTLLQRIPRATSSALAAPSTAVNTVINPRAGGNNMSNRVPFTNIGGYQKKKSSSWATPATALGARGHVGGGGLLFKKKHHASATNPYRQQQFGGGAGFNNHINIKHGKRRPR